MSWVSKPLDEEKVVTLSTDHGIPEVIASLVSRLDLEGGRQIKRFLHPKLTHLNSPFTINRMDDAVNRLIQAIEAKERVFAFGDYDVDGVTSTALFVDVMRSLGVDVVFAVPRRSDDGYGLNPSVLEERVLRSDPGFDLVVTLDCGSNDFETLEILSSKEIDVLVIDHHQIRGDVQKNALIVNPHLEKDAENPGKLLCSVALTFKLMQGLLMRLRAQGMEEADSLSLKDYLDLVALGTLTDLVPLIGENRILVSHGLQRMGKSKHTGLQALMDVCSLPYGKAMDVTDVSFKLGPRINAGGRMGDATVSVNLLLSKSFNESAKIAHELDLLNQNRQSTEREIYDQVLTYLSRYPLNKAIILYDSDWHTGVVGIVSSRLARQYRMPAVVLGSEDSGIARGSVRSVEPINIVKALESCDHLLENWGGHPMAAGLSLKPENLEDFRSCFEKAVACQLEEEKLDCQDSKCTEIDVWIEAKDIDHKLLFALKSLGPFGICNPEPLLAMKRAELASKVSRFGVDNFKFWVSLNNVEFDLMCLGWGFPSRIPEGKRPIDLVFNLKWHEWKGRGYPQATIIDWRYSA